MNRGTKVLAGLLSVVAVELAVLDYAAYRMMHDGVTIEVSTDELEAAAMAAMEDMKNE